MHKVARPVALPKSTLGMLGALLAIAVAAAAGCGGGGGASPSGSGGSASGGVGMTGSGGGGGTAADVAPPPPDAADAGADTPPPGSDATEARPDTMSAGLAVVSVTPAARSLKAALDASIVVHFDRPVARDSVVARSLWAFGRWSGPMDGAFTFSDGDATVTLKPRRPFSAGDRVTVILANTLKGTDGTSLRKQGYSFQFWSGVKPAPLKFAKVQTLTVRASNNTPTRSYGGTASDLNGDGFLDLMIINEDTADMRVFMNDKLGKYLPFRQPTTPLADRASPSEASDFNADGIVDMVTANLDADNLTVLIGKGDGSFQPAVKYPTKMSSGSAQPRGLAVLDVDGDGDVDIVNTNNNSSTMALFINDGTGKFTGPTIFDGGLKSGTRVDGEFALFSADMNEDGILDLVIGGKRAGGTVVNLGDGLGAFTFGGAFAPATTPWQLAVGDFNGDGHEDVCTADADLDEGASKDTITILLGDGKGGLRSVQSNKAIGAPFAIDVGDLDGDGDLDIVVSNYRGGAWQIFENAGTGDALFRESAERHEAASSSSCAIIADVDNDGDLDLVEIDENADEINLRTH